MSSLRSRKQRGSVERIPTIPGGVAIADEPEAGGRYASRPCAVGAEQRATILAARAAGKTLRQIAGEHGCSHVTVANIIEVERAA
jgi:hypothetical protein